MTKTTEPEVFEVLRKIRYETTVVQGLVTEALRMLASMDIPTVEEGDFRCDSCGRLMRTERALALHNQNVHNGPVVPLSPEEEAAA